MLGFRVEPAAHTRRHAVGHVNPADEDGRRAPAAQRLGRGRIRDVDLFELDREACGGEGVAQGSTRGEDVWAAGEEQEMDPHGIMVARRHPPWPASYGVGGRLVPRRCSASMVLSTTTTPPRVVSSARSSIRIAR